MSKRHGISLHFPASSCSFSSFAMGSFLPGCVVPSEMALSLRRLGSSRCRCYVGWLAARAVSSLGVSVPSEMAPLAGTRLGVQVQYVDDGSLLVVGLSVGLSGGGRAALYRPALPPAPGRKSHILNLVWLRGLV